MAVREPRERHNIVSSERLVSQTAAIFRANAVAWVGATYRRSDDDQFVWAAGQASDAARSGTKSKSGAVHIAAGSAATAVGVLIKSILAARSEPSTAHRIKEDCAFDTANMIAVTAASFDYSSIWEEVRVDADKLLEFNPSLVMVGPLWSRLAPQWSETAWVELRGFLRSWNWDVWIDWYEHRLHGGTRGENSELNFAGVPTEIWDLGPAAANSWITAHLPPRESPKSEINDQETLEAWLNGQSREVAVGIAARAALRVAPLIVRARTKGGSAEDIDTFLILTSAVLRACAVAWVSARYPGRSDELRYADSAARAAAGAAARNFHAEKDLLDDHDFTADTAARACSEAATAACADTVADAASAAAMTTSSAADALRADVDEPSANTAEYAAAVFWREVRADTAASQTPAARTLADLPLWHAPSLTREAWARLHEALPEGQDWEVWIKWYENRLRSGSRGEAYELVFANVPLDVWEKGPAAANRWISSTCRQRRATASSSKRHFIRFS